MPVPHDPVPRGRCRTSPELQAVAEFVHDWPIDRHAPDRPHLVRVTGPSARLHNAEVAVRPLSASRHPADLLLGFTAPPEWAAVGVRTTASQREMSHPQSRSAPVRMTYLLDRSGRSVTLLTSLPRAAREPTARSVLTFDSEGRLADICRRVLGLPTVPPAEHPVEWVTRRWLDQLLAEAVAHPGRPGTWAEAAALHPLVGRAALPSPAGLAEHSSATMTDFGWERLRRLAAEGVDGTAPLLQPELAAWMDAGCFARWLLAAELPERLLLDELRALLPPAVMQAIGAALALRAGRPP